MAEAYEEEGLMRALGIGYWLVEWAHQKFMLNKRQCVYAVK